MKKMPEILAEFTIKLVEDEIPVQKISYQESILYKVQLKDKVAFVTKGTSAAGDPFWTFLPAGDKKVAKEIGRLIDIHENKKDDNVLLLWS